MDRVTSLKFGDIGLIKTIVFSFSLLLSSISSAALINGDFSSGFTGWSGEVATYNLDTFTDSGIFPATSPLDTNYPSNYFLTGAGGAKISTSTAVVGGDAVDTYFVSLYQDFTVDSVAAGSTLTLSLGVTSDLSDSFDGAVQLIDLSGSLSDVDLTAGGSFDVTNWAGVSTAQLAFFVSDEDYSLDIGVFDMLTVSNILFTETQGPGSTVPVPSSILLLGLGMLALRKKF